MKKILYVILLLSSMQAAYAQNELFVSGSGTITMTGTSSLILNNAKLTNNGNFTANNGTVTLTGSATNANSAIAGTGTTSFKNLSINKTSNNAQLNQNIAVTGNLSLNSGGIELTNGNINFGTTGSLLNETSTNRVFGTGGELIATASLNAPSAANPANLGAQLSSTQNLGSTIIKRGHLPYTVSGNSIARYYDISPSNNIGLNATLRFNYFDTELNANNEASMVFWQSTNAGTSWLQQAGTITRDAANNWLQVPSLGSLARWTLAEPAACTPPTPSFTGTATGCGSVTLTATGGTSYAWSNGANTAAATFTTSGTYDVTVTDAAGCTAATSAVVTIIPGVTNTTNTSACNSYTWPINGTTYTTSGTYTNVSGCNIEVLNLTINTPSAPPSVTPSAITLNPGQYTTLFANSAGTFVWYNAPSLQVGTGSSFVTPLLMSSTTYSVVNTAAACPTPAVITITVTPSPTFGGRKRN